MTVYYEETDTFSGEANYSWVNRGNFPLAGLTDKQVVRKVRKALDWQGRSTTEKQGDMLILRPRNKAVCRVIFITFQESEV